MNQLECGKYPNITWTRDEQEFYQKAMQTASKYLKR